MNEMETGGEGRGKGMKGEGKLKNEEKGARASGRTKQGEGEEKEGGRRERGRMGEVGIDGKR